MFIKSVIINGFKSYGRYTKAEGLDAECTGITGPNASGKSNMLDAICFVIGLRDFPAMRVSSMQELIYHNGQGATKKASVTLIFDNKDASQSPLGYQGCDEICVTKQIALDGDTTYFMNGEEVPQFEVFEFFGSVKLNANNPNFLIGQGKIAELKNFKPENILRIVEVATGTDMICADWEGSKLSSITMREEAVNMANASLDATMKLQNQKIVKHIDDEMAKIQNHIDSVMQVKLKHEGQQQQLRIQHETVLGILKAKEVNTARAEEKLSYLNDTVKRNEEALQLKKEAMAKVEGFFLCLKEAVARASRDLEENQRKCEAAPGDPIPNQESQASSLQKQFEAAKRQLGEAQNIIKAVQMEMHNTRQVLREKQNSPHSSGVRSEKGKPGQLDAADAEKSPQAKVRSIYGKVVDAKVHREHYMREATIAEEEAKALCAQLKKIQREFHTLKLEFEEFVGNNAKAKEQSKKAEFELGRLKTDLQKCKLKESKIAQRRTELERLSDMQRKAINQENNLLEHLKEEKDYLQSNNVDLAIDLNRIIKTFRKVQWSYSISISELAACEDENYVDTEDLEFIGLCNILDGDDFKRDTVEPDPSLYTTMLLKLQQKEIDRILRRKAALEENKRQLLSIIERFDEMRGAKIEHALVALNENFSSISEALLPGIEARLKPVKRGNLFVGLKFKVGLNSIRKESVDALSGGQRSLLCLAFLLAILKSSATPLVILDDVYAGLDMSQAENIANVFKTHFKGSQLIIASLNECMLRNANVLFRTAVEDDVTKITRACEGNCYKD